MNANVVMVGAEVLVQLRETGGASVRWGLVTPSEGYMISAVGREKVVDADRPDLPQVIYRYIESNLDALALDDFYVGAWTHEGHVYLDISFNLHGDGVTEELAVSFGYVANQLAIWDVANSREIPVRAA